MEKQYIKVKSYTCMKDRLKGWNYIKFYLMWPHSSISVECQEALILLGKVWLGSRSDGGVPSIVWFTDMGTKPSQRANIHSISRTDSFCKKRGQAHPNPTLCLPASRSLHHRAFSR